MEKEGITVLLALAEPDRAEEIADALNEELGLTALVRPDHEAPAPRVRIVEDVLFDDGPAGPLVLLTDDPGVSSGKPHVRAILPKDAPADLVAAAARLAAAGYVVRKADSALQIDAADDESEAAPDGADKPHFEPESALTAREMQVLGLLADGASNKVIARALDISVHTAKFHVASVMAKLRARNRTDAISIALREGVLMA